MKVKELKNIVEEYIRKHSENDDVVFVTDDGYDKYIDPFGKKNIREHGVIGYKKKVVLDCGYKEECIPPPHTEFEDCEHCKDGGVKYVNRKRLDKKYGTPVLAIGEF